MKYECENCGKEFKQKAHLQTHMKKKNPCVRDNKIHECKTCNKVFSKKGNLQRHMSNVVCIKKPDEVIKDIEIVKPENIINKNIIIQQMLNQLENTMEELVNSIYRVHNLVPPNRNK